MYDDLKRVNISIEYFDTKTKEISSKDVSTDNYNYINELIKLNIDKITKYKNGFVTGVNCSWSTINLDDEEKKVLETIKNKWKEKVQEEYTNKLIYCLQNSSKDLLCKHILSMLDDIKIDEK
jgi:hypothetical protein